MSSASTVESLPRRVYSPADVAGFFSVSRQTVLDWAKNGRLPKPIVIGKTIRWRSEVIDAILAGQASA